jgi:translation initiation factor IF-1
MSGAGRKSQFRKGVTSEFDNDQVDLEEGDMIGRITSNRGGNVFDVVLPSNETIMVKLPNKFHKVIWLKVKDYVIIEGVSNSSEEISAIKHILNKERIKHLIKSNQWPSSFNVEESSSSKGQASANPYMDDIMPDYEEQEEYDEEGEGNEDV